MNIVITKGPIRHNKVNRNVGDVLTVDDANGWRLIKLGVATMDTSSNSVISGASEEDDDEQDEDDKQNGNGTNDDDGKQPPIIVDKMTRDEIAHELSLRGIGYKPSSSRDQLADKLKESISKEVK